MGCRLRLSTLPSKLYYLKVSAEGTDEALRMIGAIRLSAAHRKRDGDSWRRRDVPTRIAPPLIDRRAGVSPLALAEDSCTPNCYNHRSLPFSKVAPTLRDPQHSARDEGPHTLNTGQTDTLGLRPCGLPRTRYR